MIDLRKAVKTAHIFKTVTHKHECPNLVDFSRPFEEKTLEAQCHGNTLEYVRTIKRPRVIKTHLPFSHLPQNLLEKAKVVYVCRGAKDQIVSYYHHMCLDDTVKMDVEEFARHMMKSRIHYGDYFAHLKVNSIKRKLKPLILKGLLCWQLFRKDGHFGITQT